MTRKFLQPLVDALAGLTAMMRPGRLRELAGARAAAVAGLLPGAGDVFGAPPTERAAPEVELRRAFEGVTSMLRGLAVRSPVLVVLDDLQNAGQATVEFLHYLARRSGPARRQWLRSPAPWRPAPPPHPMRQAKKAKQAGRRRPRGIGSI